MISSQVPTIQLREIKNVRDALIVREIRNECRLFMTNDSSSINIFRQLVWYLTKYKPQNNKGGMYGFLFKTNGRSAGFGLISLKNGKYFVTGGLRKSERGKGLGKRLFLELIKSVPSKEVWLEVLDSNIAAKKLYIALGFRKTSQIQANGKKVNVMIIGK